MDREDFAPAGIVRQRAEVDCAQLAAAYRAKSAGRALKLRVPTVPAASGEACGFCGISGRVGCAHFAKAEPRDDLVPYRLNPPVMTGRKP